MISDVTRMRGDGVCVAALDAQGRSVRPIPAAGVNHRRAQLRLADGAVVKPGLIVEGDFAPSSLQAPPHLEDIVYTRSGLQAVGQAERGEFLQRLKQSCSPGLSELYGAEVHEAPKGYLLEGVGRRSLGTVRPSLLVAFTLQERDGTLRPRLRFATREDSGFWDLPIVDLGIWGWVNEVAEKRSLASAQAAVDSILMRGGETYLRIGLTRGFTTPEWEGPKRCFLQVIGIHTQQDYLGGRGWADFPEYGVAKGEGSAAPK
jgi:hypothetical protein